MITLENVESVFTWRLVLATLSGRPIRIIKIRPSDRDTGLADYEVTFLRLLESVTNGSVMEISYSGTTLVYKPGLITGGKVSLSTPLSQDVGYFIEPLLCLLPFAKMKSEIKLTGITAGQNMGAGVDLIRTGFFPVLMKFGVLNLELAIEARGSAPQGGGTAVLRVNTPIKTPKTLHATDQISVNKIRGVAYSTRVSPATVNRVIAAARAALQPVGVDTHVYADVARGQESGLDPGFGITLVGETKRKLPVCTELIAGVGSVPEDLGKDAANNLIKEISRRGCVGSKALPLLLVYMTLGPEDIGRALINKSQLSPMLVQLLRDIAELWPGQHAVFKEDSDEHGNLTMLVKGTGFVNANMKIN